MRFFESPCSDAVATGRDLGAREIDADEFGFRVAVRQRHDVAAGSATQLQDTRPRHRRGVEAEQAGNGAVRLGRVWGNGFEA